VPKLVKLDAASADAASVCIAPVLDITDSIWVT
jgi:hypothetical protein